MKPSTSHTYAVGNDLHEMRARARDRARVDATANINRDLRRWRESMRRLGERFEQMGGA